MNTIFSEDIVLVLTDRGYVASYDDVHMLFWDQKDSEILLKELSKKFKKKNIHLMDGIVPFDSVDEAIQEFLKRLPGVEVSYLLKSFDLESRTGVFQFKIDNSNAWTSIPVSLSALLCYKLSKKDYRELHKGDFYVGTVFNSRLNAESFKANPFRLVEFIPGPESDIPHNYKLELVYETLAERLEKVAADGSVKVFYKFQKLNPSDYRRYECHTVNKKFKDCRENLQIIPAV